MTKNLVAQVPKAGAEFELSERKGDAGKQRGKEVRKSRAARRRHGGRSLS